MGVIYEAIEKSLSRKVAIKVLASHLVSKPSAVERFHREAKTVARLHHTNIVSVLGAGFENDVHFFVMQFIEGESIDRLIQSEKFLSQYKNNWNWIAETMKRVALALRHAHQQNVLHRDIKPGNILIDQYGKPWVTDFGLAKLDDFEDLTRPGDAVGTLRYMAPEQMAGEPDVRSDIYGLGMVMYELLVSQKAFSGVQGRELLERISKGDLPPPQRLNSRIPLDLAKIVEKAIHPSPKDRYQQAVDLAEDLDRWQQDLPISARRLNPIQKTSRWARRNPVVAGLSFVVACLVISLGVAFSFVSMAWINESSVRQDLQVARKQAEDERRNVERNVEIAMQVLMELSEGLDRPGMVSQEIPSQVQLFSPYGGLPISSATENRLKAIQRFYVSLAETSSSDREIRIRSALANVRLAEILIQLGRFQEAVGHLSNVRKELQASTGFEFEKLLFHSVDVLADAHLNLQNYTEAERLFQDQLVRIGESSLDEKFKTMETGKAFLGLSRAAHWSGQVDLWNQNSRLAISSFEKVMADDPPSKSSVAAVFLARAYLSLPPRHSTDGHSEFTQQARLRAVDIFYQLCVGSTLFGETTRFNHLYFHDYCAALSELRLEDEKIVLKTGESLDVRDLIQGAIQECGKIVSEHPEFPAYRFVLANCQLNLAARVQTGFLELSQRAKQNFIRLSREFPDNANFLTECGRVHFRIGSYRLARRDLAQAKSELLQAARFLERSLAIDSNYPKSQVMIPLVHQKLADVYDGLGDRPASLHQRSLAKMYLEKYPHPPVPPDHKF